MGLGSLVSFICLQCFIISLQKSLTFLVRFIHGYLRLFEAIVNVSLYQHVCYWYIEKLLTLCADYVFSYFAESVCY